MMPARWPRLALLCLVLLAGGGVCCLGAGKSGQSPPPSVSITEDGVSAYQYKPDEARYAHKLYHFLTGGQPNYGISLVLDQRKQADGNWKTATSAIGMPLPTEANWYHSGFLGLTANGQPVMVSDPKTEVVETGHEGILDFTWSHPLLNIRARFIAEPATDHLLLELRWEPTPELKTLDVTLWTYPQGYRVSEPDRLKGKSLDRHLITAQRDLAQVQTVTLDLPTEWWQIYADNTLEQSPVYNPGGPCGLAMVPGDVAKATVELGSYTVTIRAELNPASGRARFVLWDFSGKSIAQAKKLVAEQAPALQERMRAGSWLPTTVTSFDAATEQQRVSELAKAAGKHGASRVKMLRHQIGVLALQRDVLADSKQPLQAESDLRAAITQYRIGCWQAERSTRRNIRVLMIEGPFAYAWKMEPTIRQTWGPDALRCGGYISKYWAGQFLGYFPSTVEEILGYDVVVLADIPQDPLTPEKRKLLADFVRWGGGLITLGGMYMYGNGDWGDSPLEPLLPVQIGGPFDLRPVEGDARVVLTRAGVRHLGRITKPLGVVAWRNDIAVRSGAEVWLTVGRTPFAVVGQAGEGRVMAILGTALGEPTGNQTGFWDSPGWTDLLQRLLPCLATGK